VHHLSFEEPHDWLLPNHGIAVEEAGGPPMSTVPWLSVVSIRAVRTGKVVAADPPESGARRKRPGVTSTFQLRMGLNSTYRRHGSQDDFGDFRPVLPAAWEVPRIRFHSSSKILRAPTPMQAPHEGLLQPNQRAPWPDLSAIGVGRRAAIDSKKGRPEWMAMG